METQGREAQLFSYAVNLVKRRCEPIILCAR